MALISASTLLLSIPCVKCTSGNGNFFRLENTQLAGYCAECFALVIRHKFASAFGRNRVFKDPSKRNALLVFTPDRSESWHLLNLTNLSMREPSDHKRLRLNAKVLVLLEHQSPSITHLQISQCRDLMQKFHHDWQWYFAHLSDIFGQPPTARELDKWEEDNKFEQDLHLQHSKYSGLMSASGSASVRAELRRLLRTRLIALLAANLQCPTVLLPNSADQLAEDAINALCFGRGASMSDLSNILDTRLFMDSSVWPFPIQMVRPLHDISSRELDAMQRLTSICQFQVEVPTEQKDKKSNDSFNIVHGEVQHLTSSFIALLRDNGFPATVSTILAVASKVEGDAGGNEEQRRDQSHCALCFGRFHHLPEMKTIWLPNGDLDEDEIELPWERRFLCEPCQALVDDFEEKEKAMELLAQIVAIPS